MAHEQYLSYAEYQILGGALPETTFNLLEFKARKRIDYLTASRVQDMTTVPTAVKQCMMSLIALENTVGIEVQATKPTVVSFSTDGYSENYGKAMDADEAGQNMNRLVAQLLYGEKNDKGVPLLFRGVYA